MGVGADGIAGEACDMAAAFISGHIFRATGVIADLKNGGTLEKAARMVNHASARSTQLYDRCAEGSDARRD
jgi:integrase